MTGRWLTDGDRAKLVKFCGMLGSEHAGERAAAAVMADRLIRDKGLTWGDVIHGRRRTVDPPTLAPPAPHVGLALDLERYGGKAVTMWDRAFLETIKQTINPSEAHLARLRLIAARAAGSRRSAA